MQGWKLSLHWACNPPLSPQCSVCQNARTFWKLHPHSHSFHDTLECHWTQKSMHSNVKSNEEIWRKNMLTVVLNGSAKFLYYDAWVPPITSWLPRLSPCDGSERRFYNAIFSENNKGRGERTRGAGCGPHPKFLRRGCGAPSLLTIDVNAQNLNN